MDVLPTIAMMLLVDDLRGWMIHQMFLYHWVAEGLLRERQICALVRLQ